MSPVRRGLPMLSVLCAACVEAVVPLGGGGAGESALVVDIPPVRGSELDLLFVIDNTENMKNRQVALRATFERMLSHLSFVPGGLPDLHIGVISTDLGTGSTNWSVPGCSVSGDGGTLQSLPHELGCTAPGEAYLRDYRDGDQRATNYAGDLAGAFECISVLGDTGCSFEQPLEAMRRALDGSLADNAGFVRPEATLGVVILTDEDDCSVSNPDFFDPSLDKSGELSKFRCFEKGVFCGGDDVRSEGEFDDCEPNESSEYLHGVVEYARFLDRAKFDPDQVVVAGMIGAASLVEVEVNVDDQPQVVPACTDATGTPAYPAIRLQHFLEQARQGGEVSSLCGGGSGQPLDALSATARRIRKALGTACLDGDLVDVDPDQVGLQFDCTIWDRYPDGDLALLPECTDPYDPEDSEVIPCYAIKTGPEACGDFRPHQLALQVWRGSWDAGQPAGVHTIGECLVAGP